MGVVFRQSVKSTIASFTGALIGAVVVLAGSNLMPKQELGFSRYITSQSIVASFLLLMGLSNTLYLFFHRFDEEKDKGKRSVFLSFCFLAPLVFYAIAMIIYMLFQDFFLSLNQEKDIPFMRRYYICFPLYTLFYVYINLLEAYMISQIKTAVVNFIKEVMLKGINLGLILLYGCLVIDYDVFIYSFVFSNLLAVVILFLIARKNVSFTFSFRWHLLSKKEYREIISFALYHALMSVSFTLLGFLDGILIGSLDKNGLNAVSVYTNAVFITGFMIIPYRAMLSTATGDITRAYAQKDHDKVNDIYNRSGLNILIATVFMAAIIIPNLHNAVYLMGEGFEEVLIVSLILIIGKLADCGTGLNDIALNMTSLFKVNFYLSIGVVAILLILYRLIIPDYGIQGAAWALTGALVVFNLVKTLIVWKKLDLNPFSKGSWKSIMIGLIACGVGLFITKLDNPYWDTIVRSLAITVCFAGLVIWIKPSKDINHYIEETLKKKRLF